MYLINVALFSAMTSFQLFLAAKSVTHFPPKMASFAEQNAVRCKEAGNVLYKNERYEEVRFFYSLLKMLSCFVFCTLFARIPGNACSLKNARENVSLRRFLKDADDDASFLPSFKNFRPSKSTPNLFSSTARTRRYTRTERRHISISKTLPKRCSMRKRAREWTKRGRKGTIEKRNVYMR